MRSIPFVSQAQRGLFYATAGGADTGVPKSVAAEFIAHDKPGKLPEHVKKRADGGGVGLGGDDNFGRQHQQGGGLSLSNSDSVPFWTRQAAHEMLMPGGFINSSVSGRTDRLPVAVAADSHVIPADVISGMGQGSSLAGARILNEALKTGPYGTSFAPKMGGRGPSGGSPPHPPGLPPGAAKEFESVAKGGKVGEPDVAHCLLAGGEFSIPPHDWTDHEGNSYRGVQSLGGGNLEKGHAVLRNMTKYVRDHVKEFLRTAPPPKR